MTILFICDEYPPGRTGGIGTVVQVLGRELVKQGHNVFVAGLYPYHYGETDYEEDQGVKVWRLRYGLKLPVGPDSIVHKIINTIPGQIKQHLNKRQAFNTYISFIKELIKKENIQIIELPDWNTFAMRLGLLVQWPKFDVPLVVKSHGSYTYFADEMHGPAKPNLVAIDRALFERADALSAVSLYTATKNKQLFSIKKEITVLYNAIERMALPVASKKAEQKVMFTGTLMAKKGIFQLMKAWNLVIKTAPDAELIAYGKGDVAPLKKLLSPEALKTVTFAGHVPRETLFRELSSATLAVFPSYSETFGLGVVEAMAVGCPVIYTKRSCGPEIVEEGVNGLLVDPDHIEEIAEKIILLLKDKALQKAFSERGPETVDRRFNIALSAKQHIAYYSSVIHNFKP